MEAKPTKVVQGTEHGTGTHPWRIEIIDAQQPETTRAASHQPGEQGRPQIAQMQRS
jgi:hypothetical protein